MASLYLYYPLLLALYVLTKHVLNKIQNLPPSPFPTLPILGHLYLFKKPLHRSLAKLSAHHGPIIFLRLGFRPTLVVSSPSYAEECFTKHDAIFANRPKLLAGKHLGQNYTTLTWAPYGDHWRHLRRISAVEIFSSHRLQALSRIRADEVRLLLRRISGGPPTVEMKTALFEMMLNVLMRMIAGKRYYGTSDGVAAAEETRRFQYIVAETFRMGGVSNLGDFLPGMRIVGARVLEKKLAKLRKERDEFMQGLIEEHRDRGSIDDERKNKPMVEVLLSLQMTEPEYYTDEMIRGLMTVLLVAGTDTSVATMEWALSLLLNHPCTLKKAQAEIDERVGHHRLIEESDLANLPYLRWIINETMRIYPPGPLLVPHESSEECTVGGYRVPRGTMLLVNMWAIQNDPKIWTNPREFRPERFDGLDLEGPRDGFKLLPFGTGRRGCPGEGLALRMIGLVLGSLIQCFEWERVSEEMVDMTEGLGLTLPKSQPLVARCRGRPATKDLLSQT